VAEFPKVETTGSGEPARVAAEVLERLIHRAFLRRGLSEEHAGWVAEGLVEASLRGIDTHGVRLVPTYLAELDGGRARARPEIRRAGGKGTAVVLDAGGALGVVAGRAAADELIELVRGGGVGMVVVRNSNHFGPASLYSLHLARHGVLGLVMTNSDALVAPFGGAEPVIGTNPLSLAARGEGDDLFCADFATSQISYSRVRAHGQTGRPLEPGWAVRRDGADAGQAEEVSALKPLGGYKGEGLGMIVEILSAVAAGEPLDHELSHLYGEPYDEPRRVAHCLFGVDLEALGDPGAFRSRLSRLLAAVRGAGGESGARVQVPGDPEREAEAERSRLGIPLTPAELEHFRRIDGEAPAAEREGI